MKKPSKDQKVRQAAAAIRNRLYETHVLGQAIEAVTAHPCEVHPVDLDVMGALVMDKHKEIAVQVSILEQLSAPKVKTAKLKTTTTKKLAVVNDQAF